MTARVPVAHIITKLELGGAQQNTLFTVTHLDSTRYRPILISGEPGYLDQEARALTGVEVYQVPSMVRRLRPLSDVRVLISLTSLLARLQPTIVHTHSSKAGILGRWAARLAGVPLILHSIHGFGFTPGQSPVVRRALLAAERSAARFTTRFFAVSEANRQTGIELGLFSPDRCAVIRSGVDLDAYRRTRVDRRTKQQELGLESGCPVIGMVAPLKPQKAPLDFVRVAALVHRARPEARFLFVGDGELRRAMEAEIARLGLSAVVTLLGWRRDIAEIMRCLDVFLLTSLWEGLPRVFLEALASGVPVVGTKVDGAAEVIQDGVNGYLAEPADIGALADRVLVLLNDPRRAIQMGQNGQTLPDEFDIQDMVRRQEREYERLLQELEQRRRLSVAQGCDTPARN
jgi:glycosyltransferase involved in cell wall biosynthesis